MLEEKLDLILQQQAEILALLKKEKKSVFTPPSLEEVTLYCRERGKGVQPQTFLDFYASKNWMIGKNKMKDWKAAVRTWEKKTQEVTARPKMWVSEKRKPKTTNDLLRPDLRAALRGRA